jgi:hypothetical protein
MILILLDVATYNVRDYNIQHPRTGIAIADLVAPRSDMLLET